MKTTKSPAVRRKRRVIPRITVDLEEPARERWIAPGRKIAGLVNKLTDSMLEVSSELLPAPLRPLLSKKEGVASLLAKIPCRFLSNELMDESIGLSKATGIPASLLALSNCSYDFTQLQSGIFPTACSAGIYHNKAKQPVMVRYMDWGLPEDIAKYTIVVDYVRDGIPAYSALGFAGFLGVITAMASGWALAMNQAPAARVKKFLSYTPTTYAIRTVCDNSETFHELQHGLMTVKTMTPFMSLICGTEVGEELRIERPEHGKATKEKPPKGRSLALTNHYIHKNHRALNTDTFWTDEEGLDWCSDTEERLCEVEEIAHSLNRSERLPALGMLKVDPVFNSCTAHIALMCPASEEFKYSVHPPRK